MRRGLAVLVWTAGTGRIRIEAARRLRLDEIRCRFGLAVYIKGNHMHLSRWIAALLLAFSVNAQAEFKDGNDLLKDLESNNIVDEMVALGYIIGVSDVGVGIIHCVPHGVRAKQLVDMTRNYLKLYPSDRHLSADTLINRMLKAQWPCKRSNT